MAFACASSTAYAGRFAAFAEACAETCAREAASRLLRRCGLEPMLLRCRKVELLQARGEVLGPAAEAISRETLSAALREAAARGDSQVLRVFGAGHMIGDGGPPPEPPTRRSVG